MTRSSIGKLPLWALLLATLSVLALGCANLRTGDAEIHGIVRFKVPAFPKTGGNKVQIFNEMQYQPSYKSQEGPRLLPPPASAPVTGRELVYSIQEYAGLDIHADLESSYDAAEAAQLFSTNCTVCHGVSMKGDGVIATMMREQGIGPVPADLTLQLTQDSSLGQLFGFISSGGRQGQVVRVRATDSAAVTCEAFQGFVYTDCVAIQRAAARPPSSPMPEFSLLLTPEERWALALYVLGR